MTEIGEFVAKSNETDLDHKDNCPFCYETPHDFKSKKAKQSDKVTSIPEQLACEFLKVTGPWNHTTAKHHLISAKQCYARVRRLVRMGSMVGYDINDPPNGIGLPTVAKNIKYTVNNIGPKSYGRFADDEIDGIPGKTFIAYKVMDQAKAQWHVGHHAIKLSGNIEAEEEAGETDDSKMGHTTSYDEVTIKELLKLLDGWIERKFCKDADDKSSAMKKDMDQISKNVRAKLEKFSGDTPMPWESAPYFVSRLAHDYAMTKRAKYSQDQQKQGRGLDPDSVNRADDDGSIVEPGQGAEHGEPGVNDSNMERRSDDVVAITEGEAQALIHAHEQKQKQKPNANDPSITCSDAPKYKRSKTG